jgi:hypothetical protein
MTEINDDDDVIICAGVFPEGDDRCVLCGRPASEHGDEDEVS